MNKKAIVNWGVRIFSVAFVVSVVGSLAAQTPAADTKSNPGSVTQPTNQYAVTDNSSGNLLQEIPQIIRRNHEKWEGEEHGHEREHDDDDEDWEEDEHGEGPQFQGERNNGGFIELAPSYNAQTDTRTRAS